jgi:hypothetical protein
MRALTMVLLVAGGCTFDEKLARGEQCGLTSDCDAPLVCRLGKCRIDCATNRDCALGLNCVYEDNAGACQLPEEAVCAIASDCDEPLRCVMSTCTTVCREDRDCAPGATCICEGVDCACVDMSTRACLYNTDCPEREVCAFDQRCRSECECAVDCAPPLACVRFDAEVVRDGMTVMEEQQFCDLANLRPGAEVLTECASP